MNPLAHEAPHGAWVESRRFFAKTFAIAAMEAQKIRQDRTELFTRAVQPALWLLIFGTVFSQLRAIPTGTASYLDFLAPGILAQGVLFVAIFYGIAIIWERDLGILQKFLVSPTPRAALVTGKALSAGVRSIAQAVIIYALAALLGVGLSWNPLRVLAVLAVVFLGAAVFSTLSLLIATVVKTRERFMGIGQVVTMPLFFASNAIYPIAIMPRWLQIIAYVNPLTYMVDALRNLMLAQSAGALHLALDLGVLLAAAVILIAVAAKNYGRLA
ncbi:MAG: ABC transporter permease [Thermoplasmatota archaeon]